MRNPKYSSIRTSIIPSLFLLLFISASHHLPAEEPTLVGGEPVVFIDSTSNSGSTQVHLRNDTDLLLQVFLYTGSFRSATPNVETLSTGVAFQANYQNEAVPYLEAALQPGQSIFVKLVVSGFTEAGEARADLYNGRSIIATVRAIKANVPLNVDLVSADPNHPEITLQYETPYVIELVNKDPMTYPLKWSLWLPDTGTILEESEITIAANSSEFVDIDIAGKIFPPCFSTFFKAQELEGRMILRFNPPGGLVNQALPTKTIPVKIQIERWSLEVRSLVSTGIIFSILLLGGLSSLFLNLWIPNKLKHLDLLRRLEILAQKTRMISTFVDSALRVRIRVQRLHLIDLVRRMGLFTAEAETLIEEYKNNLDLMEQRVSLVKDLDSVNAILADLRTRRNSTPVKTLDDAASLLTEASERLTLPFLKETDIQHIRETILSAEQRLKQINEENPSLAEYLAKRIIKLKESFHPVDGTLSGSQKCADLRRKIRPVFAVFESQRYEDKENIHPEHYHWLNSTIEALQVLRQYIQSWEDAQPEYRAQIESLEEDLLMHLRSRTWNALRQAWLLCNQIRENIYPETLREAIKTRAVHVETTPVKPAANQLVSLKTRFDCESFNTSAAKEAFTCVWDFGTVGKEEGWSISHFFRNRKEAQYSVSFRDSAGKMVQMNDSDIILGKTIPLQPRRNKRLGDRAKIEMLRLFVVLIVAVFALVAGAKEQLLKLDLLGGLIAVFLIGFGADTVKNLITRRPKGET
jgi:hypothetical protein